MKRIAGVALVVVSAVVIWFLVKGPQANVVSDPPETNGQTQVDVATSTGADPDRKSLVPVKFPGQQDEPTEPPERRERTKVDQPTNPAVGLEMVVATTADREDAKVPDKRWGKGVLVMNVAPDSPADEVRLRKGDLIVRAQRVDIHAPQDLINAAEGRDHVVVTIVRGGKYLQVVLKKPFEQSDR